tara:strand:+ start:325 stop:1503 length:1179 start_codon:yes stop_codon:yes gene_type:complete
MKVLLDGTAIANYPTGVGIYSQKLVSKLCEIDSNTEFTLIIPKMLKKSHAIFTMDYPNLELMHTQIPPIGIKRDCIFNFKKISGLEESVYHCLSTNYPITLHPIAKGIVTIHDLKYVFHSKFLGCGGKIKSMYLKGIIRNAAKNAKHIICDSESTRNDLIKFIREDSLSFLNKISVIHLASALEDISVPINETLITDNITKPFFLYVGEWRPHKNIEGLLKSFFEFCSMNVHNEDYSLVIVGPKHKSFYQGGSLNIPRKFKNRIKIIDYLSESKLKYFYKEAFALILISFYEGFGLPVVEAMQEGKPVIVSNCSSLPELVGNDKWTVNPHNSSETAKLMNDLVNSNDLYELAIKNSLKRRELFSWEKTAKRTLDIYNNIATSVNKSDYNTSY